MTKKVIVGLVLLTLLALAAYATGEGWNNDHYVGPVAWYTLVVLGEVASLFGFNRSMGSAGIITQCLAILVVVYAFVAFILPANPWWNRN